MKDTIRWPLAAVAIALAAWGSASSANGLLGQVDLVPASKVEKSAGVWLDGQYLGHLGNLRRKGRLTLPPGERELLVRLAGYRDLAETIVVEPGQRHTYRVALAPDAGATYPEAEQTAQLRIDVKPDGAAVFVNDVYAGHVSEFSGRRGLRVRAGVHRVKIALPGYQPFETELTMLANQRYELKTELPKGSITDQSEPLLVTGARD